MRNLAAITLLVTVALAGCLSSSTSSSTTTTTDTTQHPVATFSVHAVGQQGPEPSIGVTSSGAIFFQALEKTMRSTDLGKTWIVAPNPLALPATLDPMMWVDKTTDRIFSDQLYVGCSYLSFSDDDGATWTNNPAACGTPANDHQKVTTGAYSPGSPLAPLGGVAVYPNVVYYAINGIADARVAISLDGGLTFPYTSESAPAASTPGADGGSDCAAGLHGKITAGPDGTVYIPHRNSCTRSGGGRGGPMIGVSTDNALSWTLREAGKSVGTSDHAKNPEIGVDTNNTAYLTWPGADNSLYLAHSADHGKTWSTPVAVTPQLGTVTMPTVQAGDPGRIAIAYYGIANVTERAAPDKVNTTARWSLFVTYSINALSEHPTFTTVDVTGLDPVQVGAISTNTGDAPAGSRNLLDFIDAVIDKDGRLHVAFADGCTSDACKSPSGKPTDSRDSMGMVAIAENAPSLFAAKGLLTAR